MFLSLINGVKQVKFTENFDLLNDDCIRELSKEVYDKATNKYYCDGRGYSELLTVGICNGVVAITKNQDSGFIYKKGKCSDDHIW